MNVVIDPLLGYDWNHIIIIVRDMIIQLQINNSMSIHSKYIWVCPCKLHTSWSSDKPFTAKLSQENEGIAVSEFVKKKVTAWLFEKCDNINILILLLYSSGVPLSQHCFGCSYKYTINNPRQQEVSDIICMYTKPDWSELDPCYLDTLLFHS